MRNNSGKINWGKILLWLFFWPFLIIYMIVKSTRFSKKMKGLLIGGFIVLICIIGLLGEQEVPMEEDVAEESAVEVGVDAMLSDVIDDPKLRKELCDTCEQIGVNPEGIKKIEINGEWAGGTKYLLTYKQSGVRTTELTAFCKMNSTVDSINLGRIQLYKRGYEAYMLEDYLEDNGIVSRLETLTENYVKSQLNFPKTADFHWLDRTSSREKSLYYIGGSVTAENAFGVEDDLDYMLVYDMEQEPETLVYFELGGNVLLNDMDSYKEPKRKRVSVEEKNNVDGEIILVEGELGTYGEIVNLDEYESINYVVPVGEYTVTNDGKLATIYIAEDEYYQNMDGYMENEIVKTIEFFEYGEQATITIREGEHIELAINTTVKLCPNK